MKNKRFILFIRYLNPMGPRFIRLLFKAKNKPSISVDGINLDEKLEQKYLRFELKLENTLFIKLDGSTMPIMHDNVILNLSVPVVQNKSNIEVTAYGLFASRKVLITTPKLGVVDLKTLNFGRSGMISNTAVSLPDMETSIASIPAVLTSLELNTPIPTILENTNRIKTQHLPNLLTNSSIRLEIDELERELKNQINYG